MHAPLFLAVTAFAAHTLAAFEPSSLFPVTLTAGFTTAPSGTGPGILAHIPLDLNALRATNITRNVTENVVAAPGSAPANTMALQAIYPRGSYVPTESPRGGFGFYFPGPSNFQVQSVNELLFSYAVYFPSGFQFNKGGKLPGPYGGTSLSEALRCSGGRQIGRTECFDLRLMWRTDGAGEIYAYLPDDPANQGLQSLAGTVIPDKFGTSVARGAFTFIAGVWTVVAQRVKLNDPGKANGELELFVNGKSVIHATQLVIRASAGSVFYGAHFQTFFGGDSIDFASPVDQSAYFADISVAAVKPGASSADGKAPYPLANNAASSPTGSARGARPSATASPASGVKTPGSAKGSDSSAGDVGGSGCVSAPVFALLSTVGLAIHLLA